MDFKLLIGKRLSILTPVLKSHKGEDIDQILSKIENNGFLQVRLNGAIMDVDKILGMNASPHLSYDIDIVLDRMDFKANSECMKRLGEALESAVKHGNGSNEVIFLDYDTQKECKFILK